MFAPKFSDIIRAAGRLSASPSVLTQLSDLLSNVDSELDAVAALIKQDAALAATVLRIANSSYYGRPGIGSIDEAVGCLGFGEVFRLVGFATTRMLVDSNLRFYDLDAEVLREHMIATALAAEGIAKHTHLDARHAYTSGLLRPIGILALDQLARSLIHPVETYSVVDGNYTNWERRVMSINHPAATVAIMKEWNFANDVIDAIRGYDVPAGSPSEGAVVLQLALSIADDLGFALPGEANLWRPDRVKLEFLRVDENDLQSVAEDILVRMSLFQQARPQLQGSGC